MKIRKLEVCGFKSFVDRTVIRFDHDITCIVGPNGCGKSNVVDAIRWVMGEQSAKQLRGRSMDDVIFNGTESRGPYGFAEVSVTFENNDGLGPPEYREYSEITVTRRLDRSGNSEYIINKTPVRLMDVTNLFLGTGVGRKAYSIIEQGRIGLIVSAKPEDRRVLIEEAAGITKFKAKKRAAENKMVHTRQNLLRVTDIIAEIEKTLASLKRQARKAERYKLYRQEIRDLELWIASHRWLEQTGVKHVLENELIALRANIEGARVALRLREAETEADRLQLQQMEVRLERAQTHSYELDNTVKLLESQIDHYLEQLPGLKDREAAALDELDSLGTQREQLAAEVTELLNRLKGLEQIEQAEAEVLDRENAELERRRQTAEEGEIALSHCRERIAEADTRIARAEAVLTSFEKRRRDSRTRLERLQMDKDSLESRTFELQQEADEIRARLDGLREGKDQLVNRREEFEVDLSKLREEIRASDVRVEQSQAELASRRSRLHSLEEIQQRFEGVGAGVRAIMTHFSENSSEEGEKSGVLGLVAERFECPADLTHALAAALGEKLQYIVVDGLDTSVQAIQFLSKGKHGRATLIPQIPLRKRTERVEIANEEGVIGYLVDLIQIAPDDKELAEHLLGDALVVADLDAARTLHERIEAHGILVTTAGEVLASDGSLSGGDAEDKGAHLIQIKREVRELHDEVQRIETSVREAVEQHGELRRRIAQRQAAIDATRTDTYQNEIALVEADRDLQRVEEAEREVKQRIEKIESEAEEMKRLLLEADDEEASASTEREIALAAASAAQEAMVSAEEVHRLRRQAVEEQNSIVVEVRVRAAQAKQQVESDREVLERLNRSLSELDSRVERLHSDILDFNRQQGQLAGRISKDRETLAIRVDEALQAADVVANQRAAYEEGRQNLQQLEASLRQVRNSIEETTTRTNEMALQEREVSLALEHLIEGIYERYRVLIPKILTDYHAREIPDESVRSRVDELQRLISRMGEINLTAIEEYEERAERYERLTTQRADLEKALEQLDKAIRKMNRESRRLFRETFEAVNALFKKTFPRMFGGGKAELRLTEPDDLLESGIDIVAMPPGKKLGLIELMSGGEKALTAVSLIFALFNYKPSPFCLLDEVDAPLDEVNISRFGDMVREMTSQSQFILITHSKQTIMLGDILYGVTMETPGVSKLVSVKMRDEVKRSPSPDIQDSVAVA